MKSPTDMVMVDKAALDALLKVCAEMNDYIDELDEGKPSSEDRREYVQGVISAAAKGASGLLEAYQRVAKLDHQELMEAKQAGKLDVHLAQLMADEWFDDAYWCNFDYVGNSNRIIPIADAYEQRNRWLIEKASKILGREYSPKIIRALQRGGTDG